MSGSLFGAYEPLGQHAPARVHHGLVERLVRVEHIVEIDQRGRAAQTGGQAVRFDAVAWLSTSAGPSWVSEGGLSAEGRAAIACDGVHGWLLVGAADANEAAADWTAAPEHPAARGRVAALIDVGGTGLWLRATHLQATHVSAPDGAGHLVLELAGSPVLPAAGRWTVTRRRPLEPAPSALPPGQPMPVIQPHGDAMWHVADAVDLFGLLEPAASAPPRTEYGLLHDTGTQRLYFPQPRFERMAVTIGGECGRLRLPPDQRVQFADWCALLHSNTEFPPPGAVCGWPLSDAELPTLGVEGWRFQVRRAWPELRSATLVDTGAVRLQLRRGEAVQAPAAPLDIAFSDTAWSVSLGPLCIDVHVHGELLLSLAFDAEHADSHTAPQLHGPRLVPGRVLEPLGEWLPGLWRLNAQASRESRLPAMLPLRQTEGQWQLGGGTTLDELDVGFGRLTQVRLALGGTISAEPAALTFGLSLGSPTDPMVLLAGAHRGAMVLGLGVQGGAPQLDVRVALTLPMALEHGGSDHARALLAVNLQADGGVPVRIGGVASGHALIEVLDGLAPLSLAIDTPCRVLPGRAWVRLEADLTGAVHVPLCSLLDMDLDAHWPLGIDIERGG